MREMTWPPWKRSAGDGARRQRRGVWDGVEETSHTGGNCCEAAAGPSVGRPGQHGGLCGAGDRGDGADVPPMAHQSMGADHLPASRLICSHKAVATPPRLFTLRPPPAMPRARHAGAPRLPSGARQDASPSATVALRLPSSKTRGPTACSPGSPSGGDAAPEGSGAAPPQAPARRRPRPHGSPRRQPSGLRRPTSLLASGPSAARADQDGAQARSARRGRRGPARRWGRVARHCGSRRLPPSAPWPRAARIGGSRG